MRKISIPALGLVFSFAQADQLEYTTYRFKDDGQNEVFTSAFNVAKTLWEKSVLLLDVEVDRITVPASDAVSGASRPLRNANRDFVKNRGQGIVGLEQKLGDNSTLTASYYNSREVDYYSQAVIGSWTQELAQKNFTFQLRGQYTRDDVGEILLSGDLTESFKESHEAHLTITQLLSSTSVFRTGGDATRLKGLLSDPYRLVPKIDANGDTTNPKENHPSQRWRLAGWVELSQYLPIEASMVMNYRYYFDDWGVNSHTGQFKLNKYLGPNWIASPEYRYYFQTQADFGDYAKNASPGTYFTGDYKLRTFDSNNFGFGLTYFFRGLVAGHNAYQFMEGASLSIMFFRYWNSLDFSANIFESKIKFGF